MRLAFSLVLFALAGFGAAAQGVVLEGRRCATPEPTVTEALATARVVGAYRAAGAFERTRAEPITVPVAVHVIRSGRSVAEGDIPDAWVEAQLDTLNSTFAGFGLRFALALVERVDNADWYEGRADARGDRFGLNLSSVEEEELKAALALDPSRVLNLYTASLGNDYLGWATLPELYDEQDLYAGVVLLDQSLPGGRAAPYNLGHTGTHEVGHWAGLYHTFSGGCTEPNDAVDDTPQQRTSTRGCPSPAPDSCPTDPGLDPIHNYMDYSDDACMTEFTDGQRERSAALLAAYRPRLAAGGFALATVPRDVLDGLFVGVTTTAPLRVTNATDAPFTVAGVVASGAAATLAGGPRTVAPGEAALLDLEIRPSQPGAVALRVETDAGVTPDLLTITGTAVLPPTARLAQPQLRARVIEGERDTLAVVLANDGGGALTYRLADLPAWVASASPTAGAIPGGASETIELVVDAGALAPAEYDEPLVIETNDPVRGAVTLALSLSVRARPEAFALGAVYPNPTRGPVTVPLLLPDDRVVTVDVVDVRGRVVAVLADAAALPVGYPELRWDASAAAPGVYVIRARADTESAVARVVILR